MSAAPRASEIGPRPVRRPRLWDTLFLTLEHAIFLFVASMLGGALNAIAGGGSFIAFPALLLTGMPPIPANASRLNIPMRVIGPLVGASIAGGLIGAILLLKTPAHTFMRMLPWLMLSATLLFTFGAGMGFVILALLAMVGMTDIHSMNGVKSVLSSATNGLAVIAFIVARAIYWPQAVAMSVGAMVGGYFGAHYAQRLPQPWVRAAVILVGAGLTVYFFAQAK
jgi:uncharacterized membrane protein YfcA